MEIKSLHLTNFRNYQKLDLDFEKPTIVLSGSNGQGKTNLVEAISFISNLKSFRQDERTSLISQNQEFAVIEASLKKRVTTKKIKVVIRPESLEIFINDKPVKSKTEFRNETKVVEFTPRDVFLFKDSPRDRRALLDEEIAKLSPAHELALRDYYKLLKERNELLHQQNPNLTLLDVITHKISGINSEIIARRYGFIAKLNEHLSQMFLEVSGNKVDYQLEYISFIKQAENSPEAIYEILKKGLEEDLKKQTTLIGIHRDDFRGLLSNNDIGLYASQGQQRLCVIALKLELIRCLGVEFGEKPIAILDDVLSELDLDHQTTLINHLQGKNQLFITVSSLAPQIEREIKKKGEILKVTNGTIAKELI